MSQTNGEWLNGLSPKQLIEALSPESLQALRKYLDTMTVRQDKPEQQADRASRTQEAPVHPTEERSTKAPSDEEGMSQEQWFAMLPPEYANYLRLGAQVLEARAQARERLRQEYEERAKKLDEQFPIPSRIPTTHRAK